MKNSIPNPWKVELPCPQCGAMVTLEETDRILSCAFCRVRLLTLHQGPPRYVLDSLQRRPPEQRLFFVPYWRLRGLAFDGLRRQGRDRVLDASFLAVNIPGLPSSLGLQARAFTLKILPPGLRERILPFQIGFKEVLHHIPIEPMNPEDKTGQAFSVARPPVFIGEAVSRIFAPIYFQGGTIVDGLGDRPIGRGREEDITALIPSVAGAENDRPIRFLPMLCPYCGADLEGEKDTWVLLCRNCDRVWSQQGERLTPLDFGVWETKEKEPYYLPFWRFPAPPGDRPSRRPPLSLPMSAEEIADVSRKGEEGIYYWLPAFKLSPSLFLITAKAMTSRRPSGYRFPKALPKGRYYPVTLPWEEAAQGILVLSAERKKGRVPSWEELYPPGLMPAALLVFFPFRPQSSEWVLDELALAVSQAALRFGRFI